MRLTLPFSLAFACLVACSAPGNESSSIDLPPARPILTLDGREIQPPMALQSPLSRQDSAYLAAYILWKDNPTEDNYIWLGRRLGYLQYYHETIDVFSEGLETFPQSYTLYRHRGHRHISVRQFDQAIDDLKAAARVMVGAPIEIEPDGIPNRLNKPLSSVQFNVWYHLGLAHYLKGDFPQALQAYEACLKVSDNDDLKCATLDWMYMTLRRLHQMEHAEALLQLIREDMDIIENDSYHKRLLFYKGQLTPEALLEVDEGSGDPHLAMATQGYGLANWFLYEGDTAQALYYLQQVVDGAHWASFGYIAAEADLARLK
jgi:tetratricopeptide (TPR) repeat protein